LKVQVVLADAGRPTGVGTLNLLNAGWTWTAGPPQPAQVVAVFLEVPWDHLNRTVDVVIELLNEDDQLAYFQSPAGPLPAKVEQQVIVGNVPGAPNGTPGITTILVDLPLGVLQLPAGHRYRWRVTVDQEHNDAWDAGFWVQQPQPRPPTLGGITLDSV